MSLVSHLRAITTPKNEATIDWMIERFQAPKALTAPKLSQRKYADLAGELLIEQGGRCYYCKAELNAGLHIEHKTPLRRGGTNDLGNLCWSCPGCNAAKHNKTEAEYRASQAFPQEPRRPVQPHWRLPGATVPLNCVLGFPSSPAYRLTDPMADSYPGHAEMVMKIRLRALARMFPKDQEGIKEQISRAG